MNSPLILIPLGIILWAGALVVVGAIAFIVAGNWISKRRNPTP